eukprot:1187248-Rhodomonas_salina.2
MAMAGADAGCGAAASARRTSILGGLQNMGRRMSQVRARSMLQCKAGSMLQCKGLQSWDAVWH